MSNSVDGRFRGHDPHGQWRKHRTLSVSSGEDYSDTDYVDVAGGPSTIPPSARAPLVRSPGGTAGGVQILLVLLDNNGDPVSRGACTYTATVLYPVDDGATSHIGDSTPLEDLPANRVATDSEAGVGDIFVRISDLTAIPVGSKTAEVWIREVG